MRRWNLRISGSVPCQPPGRNALYSDLLNEIATDLLPVHPHQQEPRVVKRRPKPFPRMRQPRAVLKAKLAA